MATMTAETRDALLEAGPIVTESLRALRASSDLRLSDYEAWAGFEATGEGVQRAETIPLGDLAMAVLHGLDDDGRAMEWLTDHYGSETGVYRAHPELCPECGGHGVIETRSVSGTWADWDGPQLSLDDAECPTCRGGSR